MMGRLDIIRELTHRDTPSPAPPPTPVADAPSSYLDTLREQFQAAIKAQHDALTDIEKRIAAAKQHLAELEALKVSWEQQLERNPVLSQQREITRDE